MFCHLNFQVFSDKDDKPEVPSHNPSMLIIVLDVKEPTHLSLRVGHVVPGVVVSFSFSFSLFVLPFYTYHILCKIK